MRKAKDMPEHCSFLKTLMFSYLVFMQLLTFLPEFTIYQKRGTEVRSRFVKISAISHVIGETISRCLPGLRAYTGCSAVSCFAGKGKVKSWEVNAKNLSYLCQNLEAKKRYLLCLLYGNKTLSDINELRYELFCSRKGKIDSSQLPPCRHTLSGNHALNNTL